MYECYFCFPGEIVDPRNVLLPKVIWDELRYCGHIDVIKLTLLLLGLYRVSRGECARLR